jgi:uncharacterized membrane protein
MMRCMSADYDMVSSRTVATTAIFTAFTAAVTMSLAIYIPATRGYFDIGEIMVYVTAMLMGPRIGAFAGGVGSAISDAILAPVYAPGTLVIKGTEGFLVGYLTRRVPARLSRRTWVAAGGVLGVVLGLIVAWIGVAFLSGSQTLYLGLSYCSANCSSSGAVDTTIGPQFAASFFVPYQLWLLIGAVAFVIVTLAVIRLDEKVGWTILSILVGGSAMVSGYFIYESIILQLGFVTASYEVPFNVGQVLVGLIVSIPIVRSYRRMTARIPATR